MAGTQWDYPYPSHISALLFFQERLVRAGLVIRALLPKPCQALFFLKLQVFDLSTSLESATPMLTVVTAQRKGTDIQVSGPLESSLSFILLGGETETGVSTIETLRLESQSHPLGF